MPNLVVLGQTVYERSKGDPPVKNGLLASRLSRSLEATGTDRDRSATYDFLLVIHSHDARLSRTVSEVNRDVGQKLQNFHPSGI